MKINTQGIARAPRRETKWERQNRVITAQLESHPLYKKLKEEHEKTPKRTHVRRLMMASAFLAVCSPSPFSETDLV